MPSSEIRTAVEIYRKNQRGEVAFGKDFDDKDLDLLFDQGIISSGFVGDEPTVYISESSKGFVRRWTQEME